MDSKSYKSRNDSHRLPAAYSQERKHHHNRSERSSPPIVFRHSPRYSSSSSRPYFGRGRPLSSRFSSRGRFIHIPYHSRPDISPPRNISRRSPSPRHNVIRAERSPPRHHRSRSKSIRRDSNRSQSPNWLMRRGRSGFQGGRAPRHSAIIGNFGCPIFHKPDYEMSPDRTRDDDDDALNDIIEDRGKIFQKMMDAKRSENLDQYYRYRDMLNEFDRRNQEGMMKRRHSPSDTKRAVEEHKSKQKKTKEYDGRKDGGTNNKEELEEIDCSVHDEEMDQIEEKLPSNYKKNRKHKKDQREDVEFNDKQEYEGETEKQKSDEDELDYDDKIFDVHQNNDEQHDIDYYGYEEQFEGEEINFYLIDNGACNEKASAEQFTSKQQRNEKCVQTIPTKTMMQEFIPLLQTSIVNGLSVAMVDIEKKRTISSSSLPNKKSGKISKRKKGKKSKSPNAINGEQIHEKNEKSDSNDRARPNKPIQSLMELSLTKFVTETAFKLLNTAPLMKSKDDE